jgi:two-component system response regulator NreC
MNSVLSKRPFNILIFDDHPIFRKGLAATIMNMPFTNKIAEAADGREALELLEGGEFALVLLDINMKGMDGRTTAGHIHNRFPKVKVIAISMVDDKYTIRQMYQAGCHGYLIKNSDDTEIVKAIETVMADKKYFTDDIAEKFVEEPDENKYETLPSGMELSATEINMIKLICEGKSNKEIAELLGYTKRTVDTYRERLYEKISITNTAELVRFALRNNIIAP